MPGAAEEEYFYKTKHIQFLGRRTPIIIQEKDGQCSLVAICNVLLLRNNLNLNPDTAEVSQEKLLSLVADRLFDSNSNNMNKDVGYVKNLQQNIGDAMVLLPRLATGIDVNPTFGSIDGFEFTRERAIFDLLDIPLYHGWIVDPQAIGSKSYNALMGELVALEQKTPRQMKLLQKLKESKNTRLTEYGLSCLKSDVKDRQLCVLFHRDHFSTMFKYQGELYLLASHKDSIDEPDQVWRKLEKVKGDNVFVDSNFKDRTNDTGDEHNAMGSTDDYHGSTNSAASAGSDKSLNLQKAIALQKQYDQQSSQRNNVQQQSIGGSRLNSGSQFQ